MMGNSDDQLERQDPESEACFKQLVAVVVEELNARIAAGDDPQTPEGRTVLAELVADTVIDSFVVRPRTEPRYRWRRDGGEQ